MNAVKDSLKKILKLGRQRLWLIHRGYLIQKHELSYLFWECTLNCNFRCKHCGSSAGEKVNRETISTNEIKDAFLDIARNFDAKKITLAVTGGEPILRKDLFKVMRYAHSLGFSWGMVSNGYLINKEIINKMKESGMRTIDISIDGINEVHDNLRGVPGSYNRAITAIQLLSNTKSFHPLRITTTVNNQNIHSLEKMYQIFRNLGIHGWRLLSIDPIGRALENRELLLDKQQLITLLNFIKEKKKISPINITLGCAHFLGDEYEDEVRDYFFYCSTGINIGSILHNGDIYVCPNVPRRKDLIQGNIKKDPFSQIWNNKYKFFRDKNRTVCKSCKQCLYWQECLGGSLHSWDFEKQQPKVCLFN